MYAMPIMLNFTAIPLPNYRVCLFNLSFVASKRQENLGEKFQALGDYFVKLCIDGNKRRTGRLVEEVF